MLTLARSFYIRCCNTTTSFYICYRNIPRSFHVHQSWMPSFCHPSDRKHNSTNIAIWRGLKKALSLHARLQLHLHLDQCSNWHPRIEIWSQESPTVSCTITCLGFSGFNTTVFDGKLCLHFMVQLNYWALRSTNTTANSDLKHPSLTWGKCSQFEPNQSSSIHGGCL